MRYLPAVCLALALQACSSAAHAPENTYYAPAFRAPAPDACIVLLPAASSAAASGEALVLQQLQRQLTTAGYRVRVLDAADYARVWEEEVQAVGGVFDEGTGALRPAAYEQAFLALVRRASDEHGGALVLSHDLVLRTARLAGRTAVWDGQRRPQPTSGAGGAQLWLSGATAALSVELLGFGSDGTLQVRTYGGTSLPYRADLQGGESALRSDLFASDEETAHGVRIALEPLLGNRQR